MANKKNKGKQKKAKKKDSWFRLPRKGEISSFLTGIAVVCLVGVVVWAIAASFFIEPSEEEKAEEALRVQESRLLVEDHQARGLISRMDREEEEVYVNAVQWAGLDRIAQEKLASSVADVLESEHCFVKDLSTSKTLAWYSRRSGFHDTKEVGGPAASDQ